MVLKGSPWSDLESFQEDEDSVEMIQRKDDDLTTNNVLMEKNKKH